ncbi:exosome complex component CSL4 [Planococcus citri]|uniref:exosome complex component CSL4 n=1 Tax=Planococcus citri TaxID=170843 RepID=UPI0031F866D5
MSATAASSQNKPLICVPGQRLCLMDKDHVSGNGTYEHHGYIHASILGTVKINEASSDNNNKIVEVHGINEQSVVPAPGDIVTAKVMVLTQRFCRCLIKCIGDTVLSRPYRAILRKEDIRATEKDHIDMYKCFRPGDIILARVLPMTEIHSYHLSTAENELGVVIAYSEAGIPMIPISWTEMQCPKTHNKELRKVARIVPEEIAVPE